MAQKSKNLKSSLLLLLAAIIWGFAFVAQRAGMAWVGPFTFNGIRFLLGTLTLLPLVFISCRKIGKIELIAGGKQNKDLFTGGFVAGVVLFVAVTFQQIGIVYTTAGKAGFITGLYVIIVPVIGFLFRQHISINVWFGAVMAVIGLYLLTITDGFALSSGDSLVLVSALFFAIHILVIGKFSSKVNVIHLSAFQFAICSFLSILVALFTENIEFNLLIEAAIPILYGGIFSVGLAFTLQVAGQKDAPAASASIILSLEALFAVIGGWLILNEYMSLRSIFGCILMLAGMILAQLAISKKSKIG
ncbi:MAG: DMT family transporter [Bacteroidales bacterium]|nr:DMT family transporter [Bacteroidales bacterium]MDI9593428.1 DMT family transporter [Bacteroidota bacterium]HOF81593.1 DMT family transporter [Bacteroidales bacterium]HOR76880.1 DMT family transporter [Bacteroidales bacterium]HPL12304.1 DMT family transporter [Bacteroidales bacterium]